MPFRFKVDGKYIDDFEDKSFEDMHGVREIISGDFVEGGIFTVNIYGNIVTRRVRWSGVQKDLVIVYKGLTYSYSEFMEYQYMKNNM